MSRGRESLLSTLKTQKGFSANMKSCAVGEPLRWQWCWFSFCYCCCYHWWMVMLTKNRVRTPGVVQPARTARCRRQRRTLEMRTTSCPRRTLCPFSSSGRARFPQLTRCPIVYIVFLRRMMQKPPLSFQITSARKDLINRRASQHSEAGSRFYLFDTRGILQ